MGADDVEGGVGGQLVEVGVEHGPDELVRQQQTLAADGGGIPARQQVVERDRGVGAAVGGHHLHHRVGDRAGVHRQPLR